MNRALEMQIFSAVADAGSFVGAARQLGLSKAAVSRHVTALEERLGARLLHRTTRRVALTDAGRRFHARSKELLAEIEAAEAEVVANAVTVRGRVRVSAPVSFGIRRLAPLWGEYRARHTGVELEIALTDRIVDLVEEGYDVAIRIAALPNSSLISRRLTTTRLVLCASPGYLARRGTPQRPADLGDHAVIAYTYASTRDEWSFSGPDGAGAVRIRPCIQSNNGDTCRAIALAHQGIVLQPDFLVGEDLVAGRLIELLPAHRFGELGIFAVYPTRKHVPPPVRTLIDFLAAALAPVRDALAPGQGVPPQAAANSARSSASRPR